MVPNTTDTDTNDTTDTPGASGSSDETTDAGDAADRDSATHERDPHCGPRGDSPFADIQDIVGDVVEGVRSSFAAASGAGARHPRYDFVETPENYLLVFDLPGIERDAISVTTEGAEVIVSGERSRPEWGENARLRRGERAYGKFRRALRVPADVRLDDIGARLDGGILTVTLPRRTESTGRKVDIEG